MRLHEITETMPEDDPMDGMTYMSGWCHVYAIAMHRLTGSGFLMLLDGSAMYGFTGSRVPSVHHVYAQSKDQAMDDEHTGSAKDIIAQWRAQASRHVKPTIKVFDSEDALRPYVETSSNALDRPLRWYTDADVERAMTYIQSKAVTA